jgi:hypothetical protein
MVRGMLSYNATDGRPGASHAACSGSTAQRAHVAHALVLGLHTVCCGAPVLATLLASGAVGLAGFALIETRVHALHDLLHHYEVWILAVSAALVVVGGVAEWSVRRRGAAKGFPIFFAVSAACFALNAGLTASHRLPTDTDVAAVDAVSVPAEAAPPALVQAAHDHSHDAGHDHAH